MAKELEGSRFKTRLFEDLLILTSNDPSMLSLFSTLDSGNRNASAGRLITNDPIFERSVESRKFNVTSATLPARSDDNEADAPEWPRDEKKLGDAGSRVS